MACILPPRWHSPRWRTASCENSGRLRAALYCDILGESMKTATPLEGRHLEPASQPAPRQTELARAASATHPLLIFPETAADGLAARLRIRSTTVLCIRRDKSVVMAADGQVTLGDAVIKHSARKIRRLYQEKILAGFAGSTADAFSLFGRFETKLEQYAGNLGRSAVELAKDWRTDKMLRNLEALLVVADPTQTFLISGSGGRDRAGRGHCRYRQRWLVCAGIRPRPDAEYRAQCAGYRREVTPHCRTDLHLYQRPAHH